MAYLHSSAAKRTNSQYGVSQWHQDLPTWGETFDASLGNVFDESTTISSFINNDGQREREQMVQAMRESGEISDEMMDRYASQSIIGTRIDYNGLAKALGDERILTDAQLFDEREYTLRLRREYAQDVMSKGPGSAAFLGQLNAFALDPVNAATMFLGPAGWVKNGATFGQQLFRAGIAGGAINATSETIIQPFVYSWRQEINSPYSAEEALSNILMAAVAGSVLDVSITGAGSVLRRIADDVKALKGAGYKVPPEANNMAIHANNLADTIDQIEIPPFDPSPAAIAVRESAEINTAKARALQEVEVLKAIEAKKREINSPQKKPETIEAKQPEDLKASLIAEAKAELSKAIEGKIPEKEMKKLFKEIDALKKQVAKGKPVARELAEKVKTVEARMEAHEKARKAEIDLAKINKGELPQKQQATYDRSMLERLAYEVRLPKAKTLKPIQQKPVVTGKAEGKPKVRVEPGQDLTGATEARRVLDEVGDNYAEELAVFNDMPDIMVDFDGKQVSAKELVKKFDNDMESMEDLARCAIG